MAGIDLTIDKLNEQLRDLKQRISVCRKCGIDADLAWMKILNIPAKIQMVKATKDPKDIKKVNQMLIDARKEVIILEKQLPKDRI